MCWCDVPCVNLDLQFFFLVSVYVTNILSIFNSHAVTYNIAMDSSFIIIIIFLLGWKYIAMDSW